MTRFTTLAGPDFMDHVHQINQKSASIRAGFEQLVTFLAMYQIPVSQLTLVLIPMLTICAIQIHHNNVSEWYEERARFGKCFDAAECGFDPSSFFAAYSVQHQLQAASNGTACEVLTV